MQTTIYQVMFIGKDGPEAFLVKLKAPATHARNEEYQAVQEMLVDLTATGDIAEAQIVLVDESVAITPDQLKKTFEDRFGAFEKGRPDVSRVDERFDPETEKMVRDLLVGAFEGGSNYWYRIESQKYPPGSKKADFKEGGRMQPPDEYYHWSELIPTFPGGHLVIMEASEGEGETHILDLASLKKGLMLLRQKYPKIYQRVLDGNDDAADADVFLQLALFDEVILG